MRRKNKVLMLLSLTSFVLLGCNNTREYTEYNYSEIHGIIETVSVTGSMIGKYQDVSGSDRETVRKNPYYLKIALLDSSSKFISAKVTFIDIMGADSEDLINLSVVRPDKEFAPSSVSEGMYAGFLADNIELNEEDYNISLGVEVCDDAGCKKKQITGTLKLQIEKYQSNDAIDKFLSP